MILRFPALFFAFLLATGCQKTSPLTHTPAASISERETEVVVSVSPPAPSSTPTAQFTHTPTLTEETDSGTNCSSPESQVLSRTLTFAEITQPLDVNIYLPPCYSPDTAEPYPLLILLHGQAHDREQWLSLGLVEAADRLIQNEEIPSMVILMPQEDKFLQDPTQSDFPQLLLEGLIPWAQEEWMLCSQPACRAIGGISRGGSWAMRLGMDYHDVFGVIGLHSAPPFPTDQYRLVYALYRIEASERPKIFIDVGDIDTYRGYILELHEDLLEQEILHTWQTSSGGHEDAYWHGHLDDYLRWYGDALRTR